MNLEVKGNYKLFTITTIILSITYMNRRDSLYTHKKNKMILI